MGLDGVDHSPANDIHEEQGKRETKAHKDSEQNGGGSPVWMPVAMV